MPTFKTVIDVSRIDDKGQAFPPAEVATRITFYAGSCRSIAWSTAFPLALLFGDLFKGCVAYPDDVLDPDLDKRILESPGFVVLMDQPPVFLMTSKVFLMTSKVFSISSDLMAIFLPLSPATFREKVRQNQKNFAEQAYVREKETQLTLPPFLEGMV